MFICKKLSYMILILCITLLFTQQSFGQYQGMLIQTFSETGSFGSQVSGIGNVNGDDYDDIIVKGQGNAYIYYGGDPMDKIADVILNDVYSVSGAGDVNNDGYDDVIVGGDGIAYLYYGDDPMNNTVDQTFEPTGGTYSFGSSVAGVGDVNNDSYDDIIIGDYSYTGWDGDYIFDLGRAYIYFGGSPEMDNYPDVKLYGEIEYSEFGFSVSGAGDFNNDTYDDVIVGAPGYDPHRTGRAYIFYGDNQMDSNPNLILEGVEHSEFGYSVSGASDLNYNGHDDVIVGLPGYNSSYPPAGNGRVDIYYGELGSTMPGVSIIGEDYAYLGRSLSGAGNVRRSLYYDVIIGESSYNSNTGRASIYFGYYEDMDNVADVIIEGQVAGEKFGVSVSGAGDVNNDGKDDVIIGSDGKAYVYSIEMVCEGSYVLSSQSDVDNFYPGCKIVTGSLTVQGSDITNLDGLSRLKSIGGSLNFWDNDNLINISGLLELTTIGGGLYIIHNPALINIDGLSSLMSIGGTLDIRDNDHLTSVSGLSKLTAIGSELQIDNNPELTSITGLSSLTSVGVALKIKYNNKLISLAGLSGLILVGDGLEIEGNSALTNIDALSGLESVGATVLIMHNNELSNISLSSLTSIEYDLIISSNDALTNIDGLSSLTSVGGNFKIGGNNDLINIYGASALTTVGGDLRIADNGSLLNIGLSGLTSIGGELYIEENDAMINMDGLTGLTSVGGNFEISDHFRLAIINSFSSLMMVGGNFTINQNRELINISNLSELTSIGGNLKISDNSKLINIDCLSGLNSIGGNFYIKGNDALINIDGLSSLMEVGGDLFLYSNPNLTRCCGLYPLLAFGTIGGPIKDIKYNGSGCTEEDILAGGYCNCDRDIELDSQADVDKFPTTGCSEIGGTLRISGSDIRNLNGLAGLNSIGAFLDITNNDVLEDINGLSSLTSVGGDLIIKNNASIVDIDGLSSLTSVGGMLEIEGNELLENINGLSALNSYITKLNIVDNPELININGLLSLSEVREWWVLIKNNDALINIDGLSSLAGVEGSVVIYDNDILENIDGLFSLIEVGENVEIRNNNNLARFCGLFPLLDDGAVGGDVIISGNAIECTKEDILEQGYCDCDGDIELNSQAEVDHFYTTGCNDLEGSLTIQGINITNLDALSFLTSISGDLYIINNPLLTNLDGFINLSSVGGDIVIENNPILTDLDGLSVSSLTYVGKSLKIINNSELTNLDGLSSLTYIGGDLIITNNEKLTNFSGLYPLLDMDGVAGSITIVDNGTNPGVLDILFGGLIERIEQLVIAGVLNDGQSHALIIKLETAIPKLNSGKTKAALKILNSFINQVNSFIAEGVLTETEGQELISSVDNIIDQINTGNLAKRYGLNDSQEITERKPEYYSLEQNYPNPFNSTTTIRFALPNDENVVIEIFNSAGQRIETLANQRFNAGYHEVTWDASNMPSGIYFFRIKAGSFQDLKKTIFMK